MFQSHTYTSGFWAMRLWRRCVALAALAAWAAVALGDDDLLARKVHLEIPAEPLASALIQFSTQVGVQVAAAEQDVANVQTEGVKGGDYTIEQALNLLVRNTGLTFSPIGNGTIAIRGAAKVAGQSDVNVISPSPLPPGLTLDDSSLRDFIRHHGTTYTIAADTNASPARWRGGRAETVCPVTVGLDPAYNDFVSARIRAVAAYVGAPVAIGAGCAPNIEVVFTPEPRKPMESFLMKSDMNRINTEGLLPYQETLDISGRHAIQGWWRVVGTTAIINTEASLIGGGQVRGLWQRVIPAGLGSTPIGTRLKGRYGGPSILTALLVINTPKLAGASMGTIADYLAFVSLSLAQNPDHCDPLPSILDLMAPSCSQRPAPVTLTAADIAFLKAIYSRNSPQVATPDVIQIEILMRQQLTGQQQ